MLQRKFREEISRLSVPYKRIREEAMGLRYGFNIRFVASRKLEDLIVVRDKPFPLVDTDQVSKKWGANSFYK